MFFVLIKLLFSKKIYIFYSIFIYNGPTKNQLPYLKIVIVFKNKIGKVQFYLLIFIKKNKIVRLNPLGKRIQFLVA